MRINVIKINQNDNIFYVGKMKAIDLIKIATTKVRSGKSLDEYKNYLNEIDESIKEKIDEGDVWYLKDLGEDPNVQRKKSKKRLIEIGEYITNADSLFPNSIIVNLTLRDKYEKDDIARYIKVYDNYIEFDESNVIASIIDGQHRLGGFKYTSQNENERKDYLERYEMIVTIMIGLEIPQQAELFATINGKQTPVNKSILYDLQGVSEKEYTELVTAHLITKWFNIHEKSPLRGKIKMLGSGEGTISQSALVDSILPLIEDKDLKFDNLDYRKNLIIPVFRKYFLKSDTSYIMKNLYNYFKAFKHVFPDEWNYKLKRSDETKYILNKTTGIGAILMAYPSIYCYLFSIKDYSYEKLVELIEKVKCNGVEFSSNKYKGGSKQTQKDLAIDILENMFYKDRIIEYQKKFIDELK
ncbi:DGQHR domain-containing protein [Clostridium butyricum]|uniref:DGQHR domain-containing protein n=1 Tax=Clostridium butyricum TaxID=1492 RepID=UPI00374EBCF3